MSNLERANGRARRRTLSPRRAQRGLSLLELLVGLTIGLLVIAAAIGTLVVSRGAASTVSDVSQLQQQGAFALRVLGFQLRQAGAVELVESVSTPGAFSFDDLAAAMVGGVEGVAGAPDSLTVRYQPATLDTQRRDCLGNAITTATAAATFTLENGELVCASTGKSGKQAVISNAEDFQVAYRVNSGTTDMPAFEWLTADKMTTPEHWNRVKAIEVCLDLKGSDPLPDAGAKYVNCQGSAVALSGRTHLVFRNVFDVRKDSVQEFPI